MDVIITKIEPEESNDMMREEIVEITSTPSILMDGNLLETVEQPFLSQSERNLRQMIEDENLIYAVQKFPIIYDRTNPNYQNKEQVRYVWSVIAENSNRSPDYCHKRWRYLRDYFVRQLRYHRSTTDPSKLKRPWVLFNKLTFLIPFVAHVIDRNNFESYSEMTNGYTVDNKVPMQDYSSKYQNENYYECDGSEIHDLTIDLHTDTNGEEEENNYQNQPQQQHVFTSDKKRKYTNTNNITLDPIGNDRKLFEPVKRLETTLDEHDHFLYSLAPEIRKIDAKHTLHFRNEVHNLIIKYQTMSFND